MSTPRKMTASSRDAVKKSITKNKKIETQNSTSLQDAPKGAKNSGAKNNANKLAKDPGAKNSNNSKQEKLALNKIGQVKERLISDEMKESYLDYAMSVIVSRALPDVRDGLKPVHRRILYAMWQMGLRSGARFRKSAAVVGEVIAKYHPHGDQAVYDSMVRMVQDFTMRYPLVNGQGNFGCFTKDTKIKLTDGRDLSFEELIRENKQGKKNYTYTINNLGLIAIVKIKNPRLTRKNADIIKIILDNKEEINCTPNHLFMMRDGSYKEAKDLNSGDSLMPCYQKISEQSDQINREGYVLIYQNKKNEWVPAHHLADNYNLTIEKYKKSAGRVRHHLNFKKYPNLNENCYLKMRNKVYPYGRAPLWKTGLNKYFQSNADLILQELNKNHKVIKIEKINNREDVYDLTIDKTHNFCLSAGIFVHNSMDGDNAAAYRYTETKLNPIAEELLFDLEKDTVNWRPNFDESQKEPTVLPAKLPNLILNGTLGIAVGMATSIPPHNLSELIDGICYLIDHPNATVDDLMKFIKGPDFPTGGIIYNIEDIKQAYATGRGGVVIRGKTEIMEDKKGNYFILATEVPYQVNKAALLEKIADLVKDKKIEGIRDLRDESNKQGVRVVIELKKDAYPKKILNQLFSHTQLQDTFHFNVLALVDGIQPRVLTLKMVLEEYVKHRQIVVTRRTKFDLDKAKERAHILEGLILALNKIDAVIQTIKKSKDREEAKNNLIKKFKLTERQAIAILEMKLSQLANLEKMRIETELKEKQKLIKELASILKDPKKILQIIKDELIKIKEKFGDERKTQIIPHPVGEFKQEDLIPDESTIVVITRDGYIKRLAPETFKTQGRGGKGVLGLTAKEGDVVEHLFTTTTHKDLLFFTNQGRVFKLKTYEIPIASRIAKGQSLVNFLQLSPQEKVSAVLYLSHDLEKFKYMVMVTKKGTIKKCELKDFENIRRTGLIAIKLKDNDLLEWIKPLSEKDEIMLMTAQGQAIRFKEKGVRCMGRSAAGVRGIRLKGKDEVIGMNMITESKRKLGTKVLIVTENGFGKMTDIKEYRLQSRGGSGIKTAKLTNKNGSLVCAYTLNPNQLPEDTKGDLVIISNKGQVIRLPLSSVPTTGRATQGVRLMRFKEKDDKVASVTLV